MKKAIFCNVLAVVICCSVGCGSGETASREESGKKGNTDIRTASDERQETTEKADTYVSMESSWAYDVANPEAVIENTDYFARVLVNTKEQTKYFVKNTVMPDSTYSVRVVDVISPENAALPESIRRAAGGGVVSLEEYANTLDSGTKEKTKTDELSEENMQKQVLVADESYYELEPGKEYCVCIRDLTRDRNYRGYYGMPEGGYDVFLEKGGTYVNVLTQQTLIKQVDK